MNIYKGSFHTNINLVSASKNNLKPYIEEIIQSLKFNKIDKSLLNKEEEKSKELVLFNKIGQGEYEPEQYLKALIFNKYNSDFSEYLKTAEGNMNDVFGEGLIKSILKKNYGNKHEIRTYFTWLNFKNIDGTTYFYQDCELRGQKQFFIWGKLESPEVINYQTQIVDDLKDFALDSFYIEKQIIINQARQRTVIGETNSNTPWAILTNEFQGDSIYATVYRHCTINADSSVRTTSMTSHPKEKFFPELFGDLPKNKPISIKADSPEDIKKYFNSQEYKDNTAFNDSIASISDSIWSGIKENIPKPLRLYISDIKFKDLNGDGNLEFYWFAVSNGKLIHLNINTYKGGVLKPIDDAQITQDVVKSVYFKDYIKMSLMDKAPTI